MAPKGELFTDALRRPAPCWWSSVCNLYTCDCKAAISAARFDHGHTIFPHMTMTGGSSIRAGSIPTGRPATRTPCS